MKKIEIKNLEVLSSVVKSLVSQLNWAGYHAGTTRYINNHADYLSRDYLSGITEWWVKNFDLVINGGRLIIASVVENQNSDNYNYAGEELRLVSTPLNSGNILIELVYYSILTGNHGEHFLDNGETRKCYLCELKHK